MKATDPRKIKPVLLRLKGSIQHYAWGGYEAIPGLLGIDNKERKPFAELWIGAHPKSPATVEISGKISSLEQTIRAAPEEILGPGISVRFGRRLPYLLKVLDARSMLSIQAHPDKRQAEEGFARENAAGITLDSDRRNYRDDNHKPEMHVALTDFWMLHGFRPLDQIARTFISTPELVPLMPDLVGRTSAAGSTGESRRSLLRELYSSIMRLPQDSADLIAGQLENRLEREKPIDRDAHDFWALRASHSTGVKGHERGILCIYLLNLVHLHPGEGTFQSAGVLHSYLEGTTIELMANSDNVLRGGLTAKHVDTEELIRTLSFDSASPPVLRGHPVSDTETVYRTAAEEFQLSRIELMPGRVHTREAGHGPDAIIVLEGSAEIGSGDGLLVLERGGIVLVPHTLAYTLKSTAGHATMFRASVPEHREL